MKKQRMTIEELRELKPSRTNMIELVCDDGNYDSSMSIISVYRANSCDFYYINRDSNHYNMSIEELNHYPSFKEEPETVTVYSCRYLVEHTTSVRTYENTDPYAVQNWVNTKNRKQLGEITETTYEVNNG